MPHEGGKRLDVGGWEYQLIRNWIAAGARLDVVEKSAIQQLRVTPQRQTARPKERYALQVQAVYADGSQEDVTALCAFEASNREVADVNRQGQNQALSVGDTVVVVRYPGQVAIGTLIVTPEEPGASSQAKEFNFIDKHILARLRLLDIRPSELCDDTTFLRRVSLDVTGMLPTPEEIRAFTADPKNDKRLR